MRQLVWTLLILEAGLLVWYFMMTVLFIADFRRGRGNGVGMGLLFFFSSVVIDKLYRCLVLGHILYASSLGARFLAWSILGYIGISLLRALSITHLTYHLFSDRIKFWLHG